MNQKSLLEKKKWKKRLEIALEVFNESFKEFQVTVEGMNQQLKTMNDVLNNINKKI